MNAILERIKKAYHLETDAEVADFLDIKPSTLSMQKNRGRLDLKRIIEKCSDLNKNWLLDGIGAMRPVNHNSKTIPIFKRLEVDEDKVNFENSIKVGDIFADLDEELEEHLLAGNLIGYLAAEDTVASAVRENDLAIIDLKKDLKSNSIALLSGGQDVVLRRIVNRKDQLVAKKDNRDDNAIHIEENDNYHCIGKVVSILRSV
ncbi:helix-turn-helix domain-containing protein [Fodinibius sp. Rm-B-1B1-1]|uniref:helix-turn-helix domain-containing protein n=1 Tax=Fodinibius alkaliphilus TaxID=3140241 RepID=UPI00315B3478